VIAKSGRPLVIVSPYAAPEPNPRTGFLKGKILIPADFDQMGNEEICEQFENTP
jgi:antitoxin (DNA-binding transcriptional repressor) of toxin-antitoxin stability system